MHPYRELAVTLMAAEAQDGCPDVDLLPVLGLLWIASLVRVSVALVHGETFGTEGSLAFLVVLGLPVLVKEAIVWLVRFARRAYRVGR